MILLELINSKVKKLIILENDNEGMPHAQQAQTIRGRMQHADTRCDIFREMKEKISL